MTSLRREVSPEVLVREVRRRTGQPAVDERVAQGAFGDRLQLDQDCCVAVEMRNCEEGLGLRREHGLLLSKVFDSNRDNRPIGRLYVAEPSDVCLAERPFPRERL